MARDDDIFSTLLQFKDDREPEEAARSIAETTRVFNCCVGKTLSAADYHLPDSSEVAGLLDVLAHASFDQSSPGETKSLSELPSALERSKELMRLLVGQQLVFLLDYDGCSAALEESGSVLRRFAEKYPTAVVQRSPAQADEAEASADVSFARLKDIAPQLPVPGIPPDNLGAISGVQIVSYGTNKSNSIKQSSAAGTGVSKTVVLGGADSYRPALETCIEKLKQQLVRLQLDKVVSVEDNNFSLSVTHKGARGEEAAQAREVVANTLGEFPMLRSVDGRMVIEIRAEVGWNRARMVEWITSTVCDDVLETLGLRHAMAVYIGEDTAFSHVSATGAKYPGLDILVTGGQSSDSFFLRSGERVDELLRWFVEMHTKGVTVRGGKLPLPKLSKGEQPHQKNKLGEARSGGSQSGRDSNKHVQIMAQPDMARMLTKTSSSQNSRDE